MTTQPILKNIKGGAVLCLKYGAGNLHKVLVNTAGTNTSTCAVYDNTFPSAATTWGTLNVGVGSSSTLSGMGINTWDYSGAPFSTGLCIALSNGDISIIYE